MQLTGFKSRILKLPMFLNSLASLSANSSEVAKTIRLLTSGFSSLMHLIAVCTSGVFQNPSTLGTNSKETNESVIFCNWSGPVLKREKKLSTYRFSPELHFFFVKFQNKKTSLQIQYTLNILNSKRR